MSVISVIEVPAAVVRPKLGGEGGVEASLFERAAGGSMDE
jgi:hypothetical protein